MIALRMRACCGGLGNSGSLALPPSRAIVDFTILHMCSGCFSSGVYSASGAVGRTTGTNGATRADIMVGGLRARRAQGTGERAAHA